MTRKEAINMLCKGVMNPVANHIVCEDPEVYCICDTAAWGENENRIDPEIVAFVINAVNDKIEEETETRRRYKELKEGERD